MVVEPNQVTKDNHHPRIPSVARSENGVVMVSMPQVDMQLLLDKIDALETKVRQLEGLNKSMAMLNSKRPLPE